MPAAIKDLQPPSPPSSSRLRREQQRKDLQRITNKRQISFYPEQIEDPGQIDFGFASTSPCTTLPCLTMDPTLEIILGKLAAAVASCLAESSVQSQTASQAIDQQRIEARLAQHANTT